MIWCAQAATELRRVVVRLERAPPRAAAADGKEVFALACWSSASTDREPLGPAGAAPEKGSS